MKMTKKLTALLTKWASVVGTENRVVRHAQRGSDKEISALEFAVYECAIKAQYCHWSLVGDKIGNTMQADWYVHLAENSKITLLQVAKWMTQENTADAYHECCRLIGRAGLYYDLLD